MDLTEISFITRLAGTAKSPCMAHTIGYFKNPEAAEASLMRNWSALYKELNYEEFWIEEILVGKIIKDDEGVAIKKCFEVTPDGKLLREERESA